MKRYKVTSRLTGEVQYEIAPSAQEACEQLGWLIGHCWVKMLSGIKFDIVLGEYVAIALTGAEVYGATSTECYDNLREANRICIEHCQKSKEDRDGI